MNPIHAAAGGETPGQQMYMIVGFEVQPCSIARQAGKHIVGH